MTTTDGLEQSTWAHKRLEEIMSPDFVPPAPVAQFKLGLLDAWEPGRVTKRWFPAPEVLHDDGSLFGGCTAALADQMMSLAAMTVIPGDRAFRTINLSLQFFKLCHAETLVIEGRVVAQSKRVISIEVSFAREDGTLVAKATGQQAVIRFPGT